MSLVTVRIHFTMNALFPFAGRGFCRRLEQPFPVYVMWQSLMIGTCCQPQHGSARCRALSTQTASCCLLCTSNLDIPQLLILSHVDGMRLRGLDTDMTVLVLLSVVTESISAAGCSSSSG